MHPRACVSAISTFRLSLVDDLAFWAEHSIDQVGVSVAKLEAHGWDDGVARVVDAVGSGLRVVNLIGLGPFHLAHPDRWAEQQERLVRAIAAAEAFGAGCLVFTTGPATPLRWEEAADALERALAPVLPASRAAGVPFAIEHTNSLRVDVGFVHSLRDAIALARRLDTGVCMEINACWAERGLADTIQNGIDAITIVQLSDYAIGTKNTPNRLVPGDGDIPMERIVGQLLGAGYQGAFDLELIGPRIDDEGYETSSRRAVEYVGDLLTSLGA